MGNRNQWKQRCEDEKSEVLHRFLPVLVCVCVGGLLWDIWGADPMHAQLYPLVFLCTSPLPPPPPPSSRASAPCHFGTTETLISCVAILHLLTSPSPAPDGYGWSLGTIGFSEHRDGGTKERR